MYAITGYTSDFFVMWFERFICLNHNLNLGPMYYLRGSSGISREAFSEFPNQKSKTQNPISPKPWVLGETASLVWSQTMLTRLHIHISNLIYIFMTKCIFLMQKWQPNFTVRDLLSILSYFGTTGDKKVHAIIYGNFLSTLQTCLIFYEYEHFLVVIW